MPAPLVLHLRKVVMAAGELHGIVLYEDHVPDVPSIPQHVRQIRYGSFAGQLAIELFFNGGSAHTNPVRLYPKH
jgi:hypothetical protein